MEPEDDQEETTQRFGGGALRWIAGIILFPFLWIGVAFNVLGLAERFSFLPGVSRRGGVVSGVVALLMTAVVLSVIVGGAVAATSDGIPLIGGGDEGPVEHTPTSTATPSPTATPEQTPTPTPTATPEPTADSADLKEFEADLRDRIERNNHNETLIDFPLLATEYRQADDGSTELWVVYRECDYQEEIDDQRYSMSVIFGNTAGIFSGDKPARLRAYGVTKLETYNDRMVTIPTSSAEAAYEGEMNRTTYYDNWQERMRTPSDDEEDIAYQMTVDERGKATADQLFNEHYTVDERTSERCPGIGE